MIYADLSKKYPELKPEQLGGGVAKALEDARDKALASKADFAFESNYSSDMATNIANTFKEAGYKITLIYFGLEGLEDSTQRVKERTGTGGHYVKPEVVKYNYEEGRVRVKKDLPLFDNVIFVDTQNQNPQVIAIFRKKTQQYISSDHKIGWFNKHFEKAIKKLERGHQIEQLLPKNQKKRPNKRKGLSP